MSRGGRFVAALLPGVTGAGFFLSGCASPGPPRPPSLHLPRAASAFTADRVGNIVHLRWMVPDRSTDDLSLTGKHGGVPLRAELCRALAGTPCLPLPSSAVIPGSASEIEDALPPELSTGPERLLRYRVRILNAAGHAAPSAGEAVTAAGPAPAAIAALSAESRSSGVYLRWTKTEANSGIRLHRSAAEDSQGSLHPEKAAAMEPTGPRRGKRTGGETEAASQTLAVPQDRGGAIDALAPPGHIYQYTVERFRSVQLAGQTIVLRGVPASVTVDRRIDTYPPATPSGLVALEVAGTEAGAITEVSLSWEPNTEADLQGYLVYRTEAAGNGPPQRLTAIPISSLSYDDRSVQPGRLYRYSVSAVNTSGRESQRSPAALSH